MTVRCWLDGWQRVWRAPAVIGSVFVVTLLAGVPLAMTLRETLDAHLGRSLVASQVAESVDTDWWQEFSAQATGLSTTFRTSIIGFAATLDNLSSLLDGERPQVVIVSALAIYLLVWLLLSGGILDRYARQRSTGAHGFFAAAGVYFWRFLRLGVLGGVIYWFLFAYVHPWLFDDLYTRMTRDLSVEREAFMWRAGCYVLFGALLVAVNVIIDYTKIRIVVEDRRSAIGALAAALAFIVRNPGRVTMLYATNAAVFLVLAALWALAAPGARGAGISMWLAFAAGQAWIVARLLVKLQFLASQTALFQASLAHAAYTAAPTPVWPDSAAAEAIRN
jgi:hypothetical protein